MSHRYSYGIGVAKHSKGVSTAQESSTLGIGMALPLLRDLLGQRFEVGEERQLTIARNAIELGAVLLVAELSDLKKLHRLDLGLRAKVG